MGEKYPFPLLFSGMIHGLLANIAVGLAGICFFIFGFIASLLFLEILGVFIFIFYLIISIIQPARCISKVLKTMNPYQLERLMNNVFYAQRKIGRSAYQRFMTAAEGGSVNLSDGKIDSAPDGSKRRGRSVSTHHEEPPIRGISRGRVAYPDTIRPAIVRVFGIVFLLASIYFLFSAFTIYSQQLEAKDWRISMAVVTDVSKRIESTGGYKSHARTVYDIRYEYHVNRDTYSGEIIGTAFGKAVGDSFDVKYNPESPEISTYILEPQIDAFIFNLGVSLLFAFIGLWTSGILSFLSRLRKRQ